MNERVRLMENRLRRMARRMGWRLVKSRARQWKLIGQPAYKIVYADSNDVIYGENFDLEMDDVRWYIEEEYRWMDKIIWSEERKYNAKMRSEETRLRARVSR